MGWLPGIQYYRVIDGGIEETDLWGWAEQFEKREHFIRNTVLANGKVRVSTICMGFDVMGGFDSRPHLFETMMWSDLPRVHCLRGLKELILSNPLYPYWDEYQDRYATYEEAVEGHERIIKWLLPRLGGFLPAK